MYNKKEYIKKEHEFRGMSVLVNNNDVSTAMRKLKKLMTSEGVIRDYRKKEFYVSPSEQKRIEKNAAIRRHKKSTNKDI